MKFMKFMKYVFIVCMIFLGGCMHNTYKVGTINGRTESLVRHHEKNPDTGISIDPRYYIFDKKNWKEPLEKKIDAGSFKKLQAEFNFNNAKNEPFYVMVRLDYIEYKATALTTVGQGMVVIPLPKGIGKHIIQFELYDNNNFFFMFSDPFEYEVILPKQETESH